MVLLEKSTNCTVVHKTEFNIIRVILGMLN